MARVWGFGGVPATGVAALKAAHARPDFTTMRRARILALWVAEIGAGLILLSVAVVAPLRWIAPPTSAFMERARMERGAHDVHYGWTPLAEISQHLPVTVLAAEDQRFPDHAGFDVVSIRKALVEDRARTRGASTLTQQVAKNLYLWPSRSLVRKGLEAWFTVWIEILWPKERILEVYLNVAEFGPGIFGAGAASERLFEKPPAELTLDEAARLAAVLPNPHRMHAARPSEYVRGRADEIEAVIADYGDRFRGLPWLAPLGAPTDAAPDAAASSPATTASSSGDPEAPSLSPVADAGLEDEQVGGEARDPGAVLGPPVPEPDGPVRAEAQDGGLLEQDPAARDPGAQGAPAR